MDSELKEINERLVGLANEVGRLNGKSNLLVEAMLKVSKSNHLHEAKRCAVSLILTLLELT